MNKPLWVVNPNYVRPDAKQLVAQIQDTDNYKKNAEARMAVYDEMPKAVRTTVQQYGSFLTAKRCRSRRVTDKVQAVKDAYNRKLRRTAVQI